AARGPARRAWRRGARLPVRAAGFARPRAPRPRRADAARSGAPAVAARGAHADLGQRLRGAPGPARGHAPAAAGPLSPVVLARGRQHVRGGAPDDGCTRVRRAPDPPPVMLREVVAAIDSLDVRGSLDREIAGLVLDSRRTRPGDAFFALPGVEAD